MTLSIIVTTLLTTFATSPNLCADVYVDASGQPYTDALGQTFSRYCEWAGPDAPVLDANVCCTIAGDTAACSLPDSNGRCSVGSQVYCEYGQATAAGVVCYQPLPNTCDLGFCVTEVAAPGTGPVEGALCCWGDGTCVEVNLSTEWQTCGDNNGYLTWCDYGAQNVDGTVDCFD